MEDLEKAKDGDFEAFERLVDTVKVKLYKTGMAILKNDDDVCDAIQETLISTYKSLKSLNSNQYFNTWITRILINKCYDIIKQNRKIAYINEKMQLEEEQYYDLYKSESSLESVLNQIEPDLKLVSVLYYYDEFSVKEISEMLNIAEGTIKSRLSRSREKIYNILKREEGEINE